MSEIKVKIDDLEAFADQIGKAECECDGALNAINWHFNSLLANFPGVVPDSIHQLEYDLRYSINKYKNKLDDAQRLIRLTAAEMKKDEQKLTGNKLGEFFLELIGWRDAQRVFGEYDPVTGEKLSFVDKALAGLSFVPLSKAASVTGKIVIKGLPTLAKSQKEFKKNTKRFRSKKSPTSIQFRI